MAQRTVTRITDDLTGEDITDNAVTIRFGIDGDAYEIDLATQRAAAMRQELGRYVDAGRRTDRARRRAAGVDNAAVRAWAASNGIELSPRGRIPSAVVEQYRAAGY